MTHATPASMATPPGPAADRIVDDARVRRIVAFFEHLSPEALTSLSGIYAEHARFKDPFNDVVGLGAVAHVYRDMFKQLQSPRFEVHDAALQGHRATLGWTFEATSRLPGLKRLHIRGVSVLDLDHQGRIAAHEDHWDSGEYFYAKLPWLGWLVRFIARRAAA